MHWYLLVTTDTVQCGKDLRMFWGIEAVIHPRYWIGFPFGHSFELKTVNAKHYSTILLATRTTGQARFLLLDGTRLITPATRIFSISLATCFGFSGCPIKVLVTRSGSFLEVTPMFDRIDLAQFDTPSANKVLQGFNDFYPILLQFIAELHLLFRTGNCFCVGQHNFCLYVNYGHCCR